MLSGIYKHWSEHASAVLRRFHSFAFAKYDQGQREHGDRLHQRQGIGNDLQAEVTDLVFYLDTFKEQLRWMGEEGWTAADAYDYLFGEDTSAVSKLVSEDGIEG